MPEGALRERRRATIIQAAACERNSDNVAFYRDIWFRDDGRGVSQGTTSSLFFPVMDCRLGCDVIGVRCMSPLTLLKELTLAPKDISILRLDVEGYDVIIAQNFLLLPGFAPAILSWE